MPVPTDVITHVDYASTEAPDSCTVALLQCAAALARDAGFDDDADAYSASAVDAQNLRRVSIALCRKAAVSVCLFAAEVVTDGASITVIKVLGPNAVGLL